MDLYHLVENVVSVIKVNQSVNIFQTHLLKITTGTDLCHGLVIASRLQFSI